MTTTRKFFVCLVLSLTALSVPAVVAGQGFRWWQNERFQRELALTGDQITRLEAIYQAMQATLKEQKSILDRREARLSRVLNDPTADEEKVLMAAERVEAARADLSKSRTLLTFRMRRILTEDQNVKMKALHEQWERERRNRPSHNPGC
jgi:Spy/CpxP family protein refolding chaperone